MTTETLSLSLTNLPGRTSPFGRLVRSASAGIELVCLLALCVVTRVVNARPPIDVA